MISRLEHDSFLAIQWFQNNFMKLRKDKCHLLIGGYKHKSIWGKIGDARIWKSNKQKLMGFIGIEHRVLNRKINHIHERSLRIVYKESISYFHELFQKDQSFTIHQRNIQSLAIELYKIKENLSNEIMSSIFPPRLIKYNLRTQSDFLRISVSSSKYGLNSIRFFASKVWQMVPMEITNLKSLEDFKNKIRRWEPNICEHKLCRDFVLNLRYVNFVWLWDVGFTVRIRKFSLISSARKCLWCRHLPAWS